jgi:hypothetical protein
MKLHWSRHDTLFGGCGIEVAIQKHCQETGHQLFVCTAEDTLKGEPLTLQERYAVAMRNSNNTVQNRKSAKTCQMWLKLLLG